MFSALSALGSSLYGYGSSALGWLGSNLGPVGQFLGGVGGVAGSLFGSSLSSKSQKKVQKSLMRYQYKLQKKGYEEFPTAQRKGLEDAGYNPMLALTNGTAHPSISGGSAGMPNIDIAGSAKELSGVLGEIANAKAKREKVLEEEIIESKRLENKNLDTQNKLQEANIRNIEADTKLKGSATIRNDVGVGTDIANAVGHVVGSGSSAYTAKKINDVYKKKNPLPMVKKAVPAVTSSAKSVAAEVAKSLMFLSPFAITGELVYDDYKGKKFIPKHNERMYKDKPFSWSPLR